jgi:hypothetical protein
MDLLNKGQQTKTWPPIHSYESCSIAQGNHGPIKERKADKKMAPIHSYENRSMAHEGNIKE